MSCLIPCAPFYLQKYISEWKFILHKKKNISEILAIQSYCKLIIVKSNLH